MPPHCDSMDGPVVTAAVRALEREDASAVLPYVPAEAEAEVVRAFEDAVRVRKLGGEAHRVADTWFFETVVRLHRAGEGEPFTGLKPAGLGHGPVVPVAERCIETGRPDDLVAFLAGTVRREVETRFDLLATLRPGNGDVAANRRYVEAMLDLEVWSHSLWECATLGPRPAHAHAGAHREH